MVRVQARCCPPSPRSAATSSTTTATAPSTKTAREPSAHIDAVTLGHYAPASSREAEHLSEQGPGRYALHNVRERLQTVPSHGDSGEQGVRAAVAAVLRQENPAVGAELLFIRRSENPLDPWSGHMAFPGGRHEPSDADVLTTAMRETHEEVGLDLRSHGTLLTRLPDVPAIAKGRRLGLVISPFVFALAPGASVGAIDTTEVAETLWVPIAPIARGEGAEMMQYDYQNVRLDLPCIRLGGGQVIWGLTHQMLSSLLSTLGE